MTKSKRIFNYVILTYCGASFIMWIKKKKTDWDKLRDLSSYIVSKPNYGLKKIVIISYKTM